jgi:hypothetical protein
MPPDGTCTCRWVPTQQEGQTHGMCLRRRKTSCCWGLSAVFCPFCSFVWCVPLVPLAVLLSLPSLSSCSLHAPLIACGLGAGGAAGADLGVS